MPEKENKCGDNVKGNWVYKGYFKRSGKLAYIGTTMQKPSDRFRWHRHNGKDLRFEVVKNCATPDEMFDLEVELITKHKPCLNKKTKRHNDNRRKSVQSIEERKGDSEWCQSCLKRRVNKGYKSCFWCS